MAKEKTKKPAIKGRPKPTAPRAGFKVSGTRYSCGGHIKK